MDFRTLGENAPLILAIIAAILIQFFFGRRRRERTRSDLVQNLLSEIRLNRTLAETFHLRKKPKKFESTNWQRHKNRLNFLAPSLQNSLSEVFLLAEDFNRQIDLARKQKLNTYLTNVNIAKLKEPLAKSMAGLEEWLLTNTGRKEPPLKYPGLFDGLFGGKD